MYRGIVLLLLLLPVGTAFGETAPMSTPGYTIENAVVVPRSPEAVFDTMTGDISPWWDHTLSKNPVKLWIEPRPGGMFLEQFDEQGNGARHAVVTVADRGRLLRLEGPYGLTGQAVTMVTTLTYEARGQDSTRVACRCNITGQINAEVASIVDKTWQHFLFERLKPFLEGRL